MSYVPNASQVPSSQPAGSHVALHNMPPPNILFNIPPPPVLPVPHARFVSWWIDGRVKPDQVSAWEPPSNLPTSERVPTSQVDAPDDIWLTNWLGHRRRAAPTSCPRSPSLTIFEASKILKKSLILTKDLQQHYDFLEKNCTTLSCEEWSRKWNNISEIQNEVTTCLAKISSPNTIRQLNLAIIKRKRKRLAQKNARAERKKDKIECADKVRELHKKIDTWLEDMQESVERSKREESLKVEADQVLSEVTHKKAEARRQLAMLSSLLKLRQLRARTWANRGEKVSAELGVQFNKVIDSLRKVWEDQLQVYSVEERGLKVMLEGVVEERNQKQDRRERELIRQWEQLLFGDRRQQLKDQDVIHFFSAAEKSVEDFVNIRHQWDKFLAPPGAPMSTSIPLGWVLPVGPSSQEWAKLLENNSKSVK